MIKIGINKISDLEYPNELDIKAVLPIVQDRENYKISIEKLLQYIGGTTINETNRLATWFKIIANGVDYGLDHMFEAGANTQNNPQ